MKILIYTSKFPPQIGGVENVVFNLSQQFVNLGNEVLALISYNFREDAKRESPESGVSRIVSLFKFSSAQKEYKNILMKEVFMSLPRSFAGFVVFPFRFIASIFATRSIIKNYSPDVINFHFPDDSLYYFYFATLGLNIPVILNIHGNELHLFSKNFIYKYFLSLLVKKSKAVVVNSEFMKSEFYKIFPESKNLQSVFVIPNGLDFSKLNTKDKDFKYKKNSYYLFIGRFDKKKGLDTLIKAFNKASKILSRNLIIVGGPSGETKDGSIAIDKMKKLAKTKKIIFTGRVSPESVVSFYKNAYFSVFPSLYEPFGIVALESLANGTPVIASSGGFTEIINDTKAGIIFKPGSINELYDLLLKVDNDEKIRESLSKNGLKNVQKYNWNTIANQYLHLFN